MLLSNNDYFNYETWSFFERITINNGEISISEFKNTLRHGNIAFSNNNDYKDLFKIIDINNDGLISYSEWCLFMSNKNKMLSLSNLEYTFEKFLLFENEKNSKSKYIVDSNIKYIGDICNYELKNYNDDENKKERKRKNGMKELNEKNTIQIGSKLNNSCNSYNKSIIEEIKDDHPKKSFSIYNISCLLGIKNINSKKNLYKKVIINNQMNDILNEDEKVEIDGEEMERKTYKKREILIENDLFINTIKAIGQIEYEERYNNFIYNDELSGKSLSKNNVNEKNKQKTLLENKEKYFKKSKKYHNSKLNVINKLLNKKVKGNSYDYDIKYLFYRPDIEKE